MKRFGAILVLMLSTSHAYAFQETEVDMGAVRDGAAGLQHNADDGAGLSLPSDDIQSSKKGTIINIPGLGVVGTLPELNFGLELLYSDEKSKAVEELSDDDLTIKGRLKHNF